MGSGLSRGALQLAEIAVVGAVGFSPSGIVVVSAETLPKSGAVVLRVSAA